MLNSDRLDNLRDCMHDSAAAQPLQQCLSAAPAAAIYLHVAQQQLDRSIVPGSTHVDKSNNLWCAALTCLLSAACCLLLYLAGPTMASLSAAARVVLFFAMMLATLLLCVPGAEAKGDLNPADRNFPCWSCQPGWCSEYGRTCQSAGFLTCGCR